MGSESQRGTRRDCVIVGGGPAVMMLGYVLARQGVSVTVVEKHNDFFRDFRGDTIHPSTIDTLTELGLRDEFLSLPLSRLDTMDVVANSQRVTMVDFRRLPKPNNFLVFAPQWDFLSFLAAQGAALPTFELLMGTEATDLIVEDDTVAGVRTCGPGGTVDMRATLTVAADGRHSTMRAAAGMTPTEFGAPIDVLWFSLPRPEVNPPHTVIYLERDGALITIPRADHYQAGTLIEKGGFERIKSEGLDALRRRVAAICPFLAPVVDTLTDWDQIKLLSVQLNRLPRWHRPGFIAIGDAAHAMSPVGGVGVNYAIQDAIALSNLIADDVTRGAVPETRLAELQARRITPVTQMQTVQRVAHRVIAQGAAGRVAPRWVVRSLGVASPVLRGRMAHFIGIGLRPEHVSGSLQSDVS